MNIQNEIKKIIGDIVKVELLSKVEGGFVIELSSKGEEIAVIELSEVYIYHSGTSLCVDGSAEGLEVEVSKGDDFRADKVTVKVGNAEAIVFNASKSARILLDSRLLDVHKI